MGVSESQLIQRAASGDHIAFEVLYRRHVERVWRYAWFRTRSRDAAADITQDTFVRVAKALGGFRQDSSFATWVLTVARSVAVDHARKASRERAMRESEGHLKFVPAKEDARPDEHEDLRAAVAALPAAMRDVLVLCELSGMSIREASGVLGWTESRVKTTVFRARRKLREQLKREMDAEGAKKSAEVRDEVR